LSFTGCGITGAGLRLFFKGKIMGKPNDKTAVAVHKIYTAAGGKAVLKNFSLETPKKIGIEDIQLVSRDGIHKASFADSSKLAQKDCAVKVTHGPQRGLMGNLDGTSQKITSDHKTSGWNFWMVVNAPDWYIEKIAKETTVKKAVVKPALA
jgi:hypothetical protein